MSFTVNQENDYLKTQQMSVGYNKKPLIRDITLSIRRGEILTLIGPNGAGKTTILKSLAGQLPLVGGSVYLDGRDLAEMSGAAVAKEMAVVLTEKRESELLTCRDIVSTGRYPYTGRFGILSREDERIVTEAMELVHVAELGDRDFAKISDGQRQRVILACALAQEPGLLLLDEPTSYLDIKHKLEFLAAIRELRSKKRITVILSLHELELAKRISDRVCGIREGKVDCIGTPEEVLNDAYICRLFDIDSSFLGEKLL